MLARELINGQRISKVRIEIASIRVWLLYGIRPLGHCHDLLQRKLGSRQRKPQRHGKSRGGNENAPLSPRGGNENALQTAKARGGNVNALQAVTKRFDLVLRLQLHNADR